MKILLNEDLSKYTTMHVGGTAKKMYLPETIDELIETLKMTSTHYYIGGGSNLLINDRSFDEVINLRQFDTSIVDMGNGQFIVGGSVRLQKLINTINEKGFGGIEYLYSVPGLVGGAVVMNAGRGRQHHQCISDYIVSVTVLRDDQLVEIPKAACEFGYRTSSFKNSPSIITSICFYFPEMSIEESTKAKNDRMALCKVNQDSSYPNFGSVFMESNSTIMRLAKSIELGGKRAHFSKKTQNWIINVDHAAYNDVIKAVKKAELLHRLLRKSCNREIIVWE